MKFKEDENINKESNYSKIKNENLKTNSSINSREKTDIKKSINKQEITKTSSKNSNYSSNRETKIDFFANDNKKSIINEQKTDPKEIQKN